MALSVLEQESAHTHKNKNSGKSRVQQADMPAYTAHSNADISTHSPTNQSEKIPAELPNFIIYKILNPGFTNLFNVILNPIQDSKKT